MAKHQNYIKHNKQFNITQNPQTQCHTHTQITQQLARVTGRAVRTAKPPSGLAPADGRAGSDSQSNAARVEGQEAADETAAGRAWPGRLGGLARLALIWERKKRGETADPAKQSRRDCTTGHHNKRRTGPKSISWETVGISRTGRVQADGRRTTYTKTNFLFGIYLCSEAVVFKYTNYSKINVLSTCFA